MLKNRLYRIQTWFSSPIGNGTSAGFNSRIQAIKSAAQGFRIFEHYRVRILFYCGELSLKPCNIQPQKSQRNLLAKLSIAACQYVTDVGGMPHAILLTLPTNEQQKLAFHTGDSASLEGEIDKRSG